MGKVKVALIGAGSMANTFHYPSLKEFEDVEMAGLCDIDENKLKATADKFNIKNRFTNYKEMIEKTSPDAVYILMPPHHLYDLAIYCLKLRLSIFIEKPPGVTKEQTRNMALLAEKNNCLTMAGFQRRYSPLIVKAKSLIEEKGERINQCTATFVKNTIGAGPYYDGATDILTCDVIHSVDLLRFLCGGEVKKVVSDVRSLYAEYDNSFNAMIKFDTGAVGFLNTNWVAGKRIFSAEMHGKGISGYVDPEKKALIYQENKEEPLVITGEEICNSKDNHKIFGFYNENRHFIDCLKTKKQPLTNLRESLKTMELVELIYRNQI